jgi:hypothetical protein
LPGRESSSTPRNRVRGRFQPFRRLRSSSLGVPGLLHCANPQLFFPDCVETLSELFELAGPKQCFKETMNRDFVQSAARNQNETMRDQQSCPLTGTSTFPEFRKCGNEKGLKGRESFSCSRLGRLRISLSTHEISPLSDERVLSPLKGS